MGISDYFRAISVYSVKSRQSYASPTESLMQAISIDIPHQELIEVLDRISDGCFAVDHQWQITFVNRSLERTLGIQRQEVLYRNLWEVYPYLKASEFERQCSSALNNRVPTRFEHYSLKHQRWFEVTAHPSTTGLSVLMRDITERKQIEDELHMLSLVAKETENAVIMLSPDSKITWANAAFTRMTGYSFEEALGQKPSILLGGRDTSSDVLRYINEQQQKYLPAKTEVLNYRKNGEPFWSELYLQPVFDESGRLKQYFSIRKEITHRKRLESELANQQKKIAAAVLNAQEAERAEIGRELHDNVNQVLTTVKLYQELLLCGSDNLDSLATRSMHLLQQSINEIRSLSKRLSAPSLGNIKLTDSVKELVESMAAARRFKLTLDTEAITGLHTSEQLHLAVYRILQEHLTNIARHAGASVVRIAFTCKDGFLTLAIQDNGSGFDPMQKNSGTGLANMRMRAEHLDGILAINSAPGEGCSLIASFPFEEILTDT